MQFARSEATPNSRSNGRAENATVSSRVIAARRSPRHWADLRPPASGRLHVQRGGVLRLVDAELPTAWQREPGDRAPALLVDRRTLHLLLLHLGDERLDVVAH